MKRCTLFLVLALVAGANARALLADAFTCPGEGNYPVPGAVCSPEYYSCGPAGAILMPCAPGTFFDATNQICDFRYNIAECPYQVNKCPGAGLFAYNLTCNHDYWSCPAFQADPTVMPCAPGTAFDPYTGGCTFEADVPICNGKCPTAYLAALSLPEFSILKAALEFTGLNETLNDPNLVATIFAPDNQAFLAFLASLKLTPSELLVGANKETVTKVLLTHVVPGVAAKSTDLTNGQVLATANANQTLTVDLATEPGKVLIKPEGGAAATVIMPDLALCGVVGHAINTVLVPSNLS